jgi:hypothetical protein
MSVETMADTRSSKPSPEQRCGGNGAGGDVVDVCHVVTFCHWKVLFSLRDNSLRS